MMLRFYEKGIERPFYSQRMSDGTLKLFAYYLLLHEKNPRQLVFIEEPENGDAKCEWADKIGSCFYMSPINAAGFNSQSNRLWIEACNVFMSAV